MDSDRRNGVLLVVGLLMQVPQLAQVLTLLGSAAPAPDPSGAQQAAILGGVLAGVGGGGLVVVRARTLRVVVVLLAAGAAVFAVGWWATTMVFAFSSIPRRYATYSPADLGFWTPAVVLEISMIVCSLALSSGTGIVLRCAAALVGRVRVRRAAR